MLQEPTLDALAASVWHGPKLTFNYRIKGAKSFTWGDQFCWMGITGIENLLYLQSRLCQSLSPADNLIVERTFAEDSVKYIALLHAAESQCTHLYSAFSEYMDQMEELAAAYDREAVTVSQEELEAVYDDTFFDAMDLERDLP